MPWRGKPRREPVSGAENARFSGRNGLRFVLRDTRHLAYACVNERVFPLPGWSSAECPFTVRGSGAADIRAWAPHRHLPCGEKVGRFAFGLANRREVMSVTRRRILKTTGGGLAGVLASGVAPYGFVRNIVKAAESDTIKVGILH